MIATGCNGSFIGPLSARLASGSQLFQAEKAFTDVLDHQTRRTRD
jgi:hypothetical protein